MIAPNTTVNKGLGIVANRFVEGMAVLLANLARVSFRSRRNVPMLRRRVLPVRPNFL